MKPGRLLLATVLLAGVGIALWWSNKQETAKEGAPAADAPPRIVAIGADTVKEITIQRRGEEATRVVFTDKGKWQITAPKRLPADSVAVAALTSAASKLDSERLVDANATDLASYGLAPALVTIGITNKEGKTSKLLLGENTPTGNAVYAKLDGDPRLFTAASSVKSIFDKDSSDLRDRHLMDFTQDKLKTIEVTARKQTYEFTKVGETGWQISKPKAMRADGLKVDDLVMRLKNAQMDTRVSEVESKNATAAFGSAQIVATVKITDVTGVHTMEIRKIKEDSFAKANLLDGGVYKVDKMLADGFDKALEDFRTKKIFDFGFSDPIHIEVVDSGKTSVFDKGGTSTTWMSGGKPMDATSVQAFVERLRDLSATKFADSGFSSPAVAMTVVFDQGKRREKVEFEPEAGGNYRARRSDDSSFYELDAKVMTDLRQAVGDVRPAQADKKQDKKK